MPNQGSKTATLDCGGSYIIPAGYHDGSGKVTANTLASQTIGNATADKILAGFSAWVNGNKINGSGTTNNIMVSTGYSSPRKINHTQMSIDISKECNFIPNFIFIHGDAYASNGKDSLGYGPIAILSTASGLVYHSTLQEDDSSHYQTKEESSKPNLDDLTNIIVASGGNMGRYDVSAHGLLYWIAAKI